MRRLILTAALAVLASPALAQEAPAAAETPVVAPTKSAEEVAIEAEAVAFRTAMTAMQEELVKTTTPEEGDAIVARYQPQAEALADRMNAFLLANAEKPENAANRDELLSKAAQGVDFVRRMPAFIRVAVDEAVARGRAEPPAPPAEPASPAPAPTDPSA